MELGDEPQLRVDIDANETGIVIRLAGELDLTTAGRLEAAFNGLSVDLGERVVLDLANLQFMDSSGLAVLVAETVKGRDLVVRAPNAIVREVIRVTGLDAVLKVES